MARSKQTKRGIKKRTDIVNRVLNNQKRINARTILSVPDFKVSEGHARLLVEKLFENLRHMDSESNSLRSRLNTKLELERDGKCSQLKLKRAIQLTRLGATILRETKKTSEIMLSCIGKGSNNSIQLNQIQVKRKDVSASLGCILIEIRKHALERCLERGGVLERGSDITLEDIQKMMLRVFKACEHATLKNEELLNTLMTTDYNLAVTVKGIRYIVKYDKYNCPIIVTMYRPFNPEEEAEEVVRLIPPKGIDEKEEVVYDLRKAS